LFTGMARKDDRDGEHRHGQETNTRVFIETQWNLLQFDFIFHRQ